VSVTRCGSRRGGIFGWEMDGYPPGYPPLSIVARAHMYTRARREKFGICLSPKGPFSVAQTPWPEPLRDSQLSPRARVSTRADGKQLCCRPGTAVKLLWPAVHPALAGENWAI
jgi:hypothetical protein